MAKDWDLVEDEIKDLYVIQKKPLKDVKKALYDRHGFEASLRAFRMKLDEWGYRKNKRRTRRRLRNLSQSASDNDTSQKESLVDTPTLPRVPQTATVEGIHGESLEKPTHHPSARSGEDKMTQTEASSHNIVPLAVLLNLAFEGSQDESPPRASEHLLSKSVEDKDTKTETSSQDSMAMRRVRGGHGSSQGDSSAGSPEYCSPGPLEDRSHRASRYAALAAKLRSMTNSFPWAKANWSLCSIMAPGSEMWQDSHPLVEDFPNWPLIQVEARVVCIDMISEHGLGLTLTQTSMDALIDYHKHVFSIKTAARIPSWDGEDTELETLRANFVQSVNNFIFRTHVSALEGLENDGSGELLEGESERAKSELDSLFIPLNPPVFQRFVDNVNRPQLMRKT